MKTLLTSTALVAMLATGAAADQTHTFDWVGDTTDNEWETGCVFTGTTDGIMGYDEQAQTWTTSQAAVVVVTVRNGNEPGDIQTGSIKVEPSDANGDTTNGGFVYSAADSWAADVTYTGTPFTSGPTNWGAVLVNSGDSVLAEDSDTSNLSSGIITLSIGGTADISTALGTTDILDANTEYKATHLVTCMQDTVPVPDPE